MRKLQKFQDQNHVITPFVARIQQFGRKLEKIQNTVNIFVFFSFFTSHKSVFTQYLADSTARTKQKLTKKETRSKYSILYIFASFGF